MAISPKQFVETSLFHQRNLNQLLLQYADLPEGPGLLVAMMYIQKSINAALGVADEPDDTEKDKT